MKLRPGANAKVCPWCKGSDVWVWDDAVPGKFAIGCSDPDCSATGPIRDTIASALVAWNIAIRGKRGLAGAQSEMDPDPDAVAREQYRSPSTGG